MGFDIHTTPFSRRGNYFVFSWLDNNLYIRNIQGGDTRTGKLFAVIMLNAKEQILDYNSIFEAHLLTLHHNKAYIRIALNEENIVIEGCHCILKLVAVLGKYDHINVLSPKTFEMHNYTNELKMGITVLKGAAFLDATWKDIGHRDASLEIYADKNNKHTEPVSSVENNNGAINKKFELVIDGYTVVSNKNLVSQYTSGYIDITQKNSLKEYTAWTEILLHDSLIAHKDTSKLASYILWSCLVNKKGILPYPAMYMSKNWMTNIWSWDNCFNAISLAKNYPELAYQQFIFFKPLQHSSGALPDFANNAFASYNCVKPPIHGWTYTLMMQQNTFFKQKAILKESYDMLANIHLYWTTERIKKYPLPYYNHGNDSGWNNATIFAQGCPIVTPDLSCYLILLQEALATIANLLNKKPEAQQWLHLSKEYQQTLLSTLFDNNEFFSLLYTTGEKIYA